MLFFSMRLVVVCDVCKKQDKDFVSIMDWGNHKVEREMLIQDFRDEGWIIDYDVRAGEGTVVCPGCVKLADKFERETLGKGEGKPAAAVNMEDGKVDPGLREVTWSDAWLPFDGPDVVNCKCAIVLKENGDGKPAAAVNGEDSPVDQGDEDAKWNGEWCPRCGGRGSVRNEGFVWVQCPVCDGRKTAAGEDELPADDDDRTSWPLPVDFPHG